MPIHDEKIYEAAKEGDIAKVDALVKEHGINVQGEIGDTALHWAAWYNKFEVTKLLLKKEADVTVTNKWKQTAFQLQ